MNFLANLFSYIFHPLLMVTYLCTVVFFGIENSMFDLFTPLKLKIIILTTVFAFTFLMPVLNLLILLKLNYVSSWNVKDRKQRTFPLLASSICYFGLFYMLYQFPIWPSIKLIVLGGAISIFIAAMVNYYWQISTHMIGVGGFLGVLLAFSLFMQLPILILISIVIFMCGLIGFSRLYLKAHSSSQVYAGFFVGLILQFGLFFIAHQIQMV
ncbi:MAG: hypothetical protein ACK504_08720 [Bacteroidota bacterium]|jgi:membrane-associated phospholipid phosphatase